MKYLAILAFTALINTVAVKTDFTGEWIYAHSVAGDEKLDLPDDDFILGRKLVFERCDDRKDLKGMPPLVVDMRKKDTLFRNVSIKAFSKEGKIIDTFFPVAYRVQEKEIRFTAYGNRLKDDLSLNYSKDDTLAIGDNKVYLINNQKYYRVKHIYVKQ